MKQKKDKASTKKTERSTGSNGKALNSVIQFSEDQLWKALMDVEDLFDRCLVRFFLLGESASQIYNDLSLGGNCIIVGVRREQITPETISTIKTTINVPMSESGFTYYVDNVPVYVKFIKNHYKFLDTLDFRFYRAGEYYLPNPFEKYWEMRHLIR